MRAQSLGTIMKNRPYCFFASDIGCEGKSDVKFQFYIKIKTPESILGLYTYLKCPQSMFVGALKASL